MRINTAQTTGLFHFKEKNKTQDQILQGREQNGIVPSRNDMATISQEGRAYVGKADDKSMAGFTDYMVTQEGIGHLWHQIDTGSLAESVPTSDSFEAILRFSDIVSHADFNSVTLFNSLRTTYLKYMDEAREKREDSNTIEIKDYVESLAKAYGDIYNEIVQGYQDGTREVWTRDFDEGADYIEVEAYDGTLQRFHKLTMDEELSRLDKAYEEMSAEAETKLNKDLDISWMIEKHELHMRRLAEDIDRSLLGRQEMKVEEYEFEDAVKLRRPEKVEIYELLMSEKAQWLSQFGPNSGKDNGAAVK